MNYISWYDVEQMTLFDVNKNKVAEITNEVLDNIFESDEEINYDVLNQLIINIVAYATHNNHCRVNWTARDLLNGVLPEECMKQMFDEK